VKNQVRLIQNVLLWSLLLVLLLSAFLVFNIPSETRERIGLDLTPLSTKTSLISMAITPSPTVIGLMDLTPVAETQKIETVAMPSTPSICALAWKIETPAVLPNWLQTPIDADGLFTENKYVYLAGELISHGLINAGDCPNGGLTPDGVSNTCGMEKSLTEVVFWQNRFNQEILTASLKNQIPAQIIKRLFAQESQFWPSTDLAPRAYGLGNVTSPGIDPLFLWYDDIYQNTCRDLFSKSCSQPYSSLALADQQRLRGFFISQDIHAYCPTCQNGIDLEKTRSSIDYFAKLLVANCHQVDTTLMNYGFLTQTLSYEDAWRLTLANYNCGAGFIESGLKDMDISKGFSWESFSPNNATNCNLTQYIIGITR
jgi:hypothetical protein